MPWSEAARNAAIDAAVALGSWIALYTDTDGAVEVTGAGYARQQSTFAAANAGVRAGSKVTFPTVPAGTTIRSWGIVSAQTGGTQRFYRTLTTAETFGADAPYDFTPTVSALNPA